MSIDTLRSKAESVLFQKLASSPYAAVPVRVENLPFDQPNAAPWFSFYVHPVDAKRAAIGTEAKFQKHMTMLVVECYAPENTGTKTLNEMMEFAGDALEESNYSLSDGDTVVTYTAIPKINGLQYGFYRGTIMVLAMRRSCKT